MLLFHGEQLVHDGSVGANSTRAVNQLIVGGGRGLLRVHMLIGHLLSLFEHVVDDSALPLVQDGGREEQDKHCAANYEQSELTSGEPVIFSRQSSLDC